MRTTLVVALLALAGAAAPAAGTPSSLPWTHIRSLTPGAAALVAEATRRSDTVRALMDDLERSDVVVYVTDSVVRESNEPLGDLSFVAQGGGVRYVRVRVTLWSLTLGEAIPWFAHELQHAIEVAQAPEVTDASSLAQLYRRIGWEGQAGHFESNRARAIGNLVRNQLAGHTK